MSIYHLRSNCYRIRHRRHSRSTYRTTVEHLIPGDEICILCREWAEREVTIDDMNSVWFGLGPDCCMQPRRGASRGEKLTEGTALIMDVLKSFEALKEIWKGDTPMHECHDSHCPGDDGENIIAGVRYFPPDSFADNIVGEPDRAEATKGQLTKQERTLMEITSVVWNGFIALPGVHGDEVHDMRFHIDAINRLFLARAGARANPDLVRAT